MTSLIGCCDSLYLNPCAGSSSLGAVMFTPAIGPAIEGLSGLELFWASHPARVQVTAAHSTAVEVRYIVMRSLGSDRSISSDTAAAAACRQPIGGTRMRL